MTIDTKLYEAARSYIPIRDALRAAITNDAPKNAPKDLFKSDRFRNFAVNYCGYIDRVIKLGPENIIAEYESDNASTL